jgi:hypothetical protein
MNYSNSNNTNFINNTNITNLEKRRNINRKRKYSEIDKVYINENINFTNIPEVYVPTMKIEKKLKTSNNKEKSVIYEIPINMFENSQQKQENLIKINMEQEQKMVQDYYEKRNKELMQLIYNNKH